MPIPATLRHGADFKPARIRDRRGHLWLVQEVLAHWQHEASAGELLGRPECIARWVLRVCGPLPGNPSVRGEFVLRAERFGDRPGWWIGPG